MSYKVVINRCYGGFSLSREAVLLGRELSGDSKWGGPTIVGDEYACGTPVERDYGYVKLPRHDKVLVEVVEKLGEAASGRCANLEVEEIDSRYYVIDEYGGIESVHTVESIGWIDAEG